MNRRLSTVKLDRLCLPGDFKARLASPHVKALSESGDIIQPPSVRREGMSVICGADRIAAMSLRGQTEVEVFIVDVDEQEAERMRIVENLHRRADNQDALKGALVELELRRAETARATEWGGEEEEETTQPVNTGRGDLKPGRPKTPVGLAREAAAAAIGTTPEAIRSAEKRVKAGAQQADAGLRATVSSAAAPPPLPGADIAAALDEIDRHLMAAVRAVTQLAKGHPELTERFDVQGLKWKLQREVAPGFRAMRPQRECPYCKAVPGITDTCPACRGSNWLAMDQLNGIPPELERKGKDAGVFDSGEFITLVELAARDAKARRKVTAKDSGGKERAAAAGTIAIEKGASANASGAWPLDHPRALLVAPGRKVCGKVDHVGKHRVTCNADPGHAGSHEWLTAAPEREMHDDGAPSEEAWTEAWGDK